MRLPDGDGLDLLEWMGAHTPGVPCAVITAHGNVESAVRALKLGAFDFVSKPLDLGVAAPHRLDRAQALAVDRRRHDHDAHRHAPHRHHAVDGTAARAHPARRAQPGTGAHLRRIRHRQGTGGAHDPRLRPARRRAVRAGQLRRHSLRAHGKRVLRAQARQFHRRRRRQERAGAVRRRRHVVPRRSRGPAAAHAGQAAARDPGENRAAHRRAARDAHRRAHPVGHSQESRRPGRGFAVSRGPLLPHQRHRDPRAAAARAAQ